MIRAILNLQGLLKTGLHDSDNSQPSSISELCNKMQEQWKSISRLV